MDYEKLTTEGSAELTANLDEMNAREIVDAMNEMDMATVQAVNTAKPEIARTIEAAAAAIMNGGRVIYVGAGTSGRLGVLDASECPPTFGVSDDMFIGIIAGGDTALRHSVENAEDNPTLGARAMEEISVNGNDLVIGISASGTAPYCLGAMDFARQAGAQIVCITCNIGSEMAAHADIRIELSTGPEALSGSTRLKAGTATKMTLNMISTGAMALTGKTYKNLMVDVRATNKKLSDRCVRIIMRALNLDRPKAEALINRAGGNLKRAIVMQLANVAPDIAEKALSINNGYVKAAISYLQNQTKNNAEH